jgi:hypothetical protein
MQNVINTVKGKALEVAEYLTPVLKVSRAGLARGCRAHGQVGKDRAGARGAPWSSRATAPVLRDELGGTLGERSGPHPYPSLLCTAGDVGLEGGPLQSSEP